MKKYFILLISVLLLTGCGKVDKEKVINNFVNKVEKSDSYKLSGSLEIYNDEDIYNYDISVFYKKDNLFNVDMVNTSNDHRQIILRDNEAVYVITPSLNKSYKFTSEWPYNSSQSYILNSIVKDIKEDDDVNFINIDDNYVLEVDVNYPNNSYLKYEKIVFDKNLNLKEIIVFDKEDIESIKVTFNDIDYNADLDDDVFDINKILESNCCNVVTEETSNISDVVYPLYVPDNTYLDSKEIVNTENGERVILTFSGEKNFVLIEESSNVYNEFETIPVYGDLLMMSNTIGAISNNSLSWSVNNMDYYLASNDLTSDEIKSIAESLNTAVFYEK
ncbi:MAG: outer membrane lipoprotein carrier protein LolA [Candidatus Coprovivens sp.]